MLIDPRRRLEVPRWVVEADATALCERGVVFCATALESLNELASRRKDSGKGSLLRHSQSVQQLQELVSQVNIGHDF